MSAADLFKDAYDVEFRLKGTYIMIGRKPYVVNACVPILTPDPKTCELRIYSLEDSEEIRVPLGKLPLRTMYECPSGYYDGHWYTRGPARNRYQGITPSSIWSIDADGMIDSGGVGNIKSLLKEISKQPRVRRPGKRPSGALTRDVLILNNEVYVRGRHRATYLGNNIIELAGNVSPVTKQLLENAKLEVRA